MNSIIIIVLLIVILIIVRYYYIGITSRLQSGNRGQSSKYTQHRLVQFVMFLPNNAGAVPFPTAALTIQGLSMTTGNNFNRASRYC